HGGDGSGRRTGGKGGRRSLSKDEGYRTANEIGRQCRKSIELAIGPAELDHDVLTLHEADFIQAAAEPSQLACHLLFGHIAETSDHRHRRLLRTRRERPSRRTAEHCNEVAAPHGLASAERITP